jgi:DUF4097 and DUF4098 domain-containing protein YvlB
METFETPEPITVDVEVGAGELQIDAGDRTDTTVEIRPSDPLKKGDVAAAEQTRVEFANGLLSVKTPKSGWKQWVSWKGESVDVRIALPAGSRVRADTGAGTIRSTGHLGDSRFKTGAGNVQLGEFDALEVKTGAGDIAVERAAGTTKLSTGTGDVRMGAIDGPAAVKNSNGDTWIREVTGEVRINSANGDITVERAGGGVVAKTARGDVRLTDVSHGAVVAQSAFGRLDVGVREGSAVWLDLDTKFGRVENELDASSSPGPNDDVVEVHAHTSYGDITIHRVTPTGAGVNGS